MSKTKTIEFEGVSVKYDQSELHKWSTVRMLNDPVHSFEAVDRILCGNADAVAEKLDDSMDAMRELMERIATVEGAAAKN